MRTTLRPRLGCGVVHTTGSNTLATDLRHPVRRRTWRRGQGPHGGWNPVAHTRTTATPIVMQGHSKRVPDRAVLSHTWAEAGHARLSRDRTHPRGGGVGRPHALSLGRTFPSRMSALVLPGRVRHMSRRPQLLSGARCRPRTRGRSLSRDNAILWKLSDPYI